jgi:hypothetical protein
LALAAGEFARMAVEQLSRFRIFAAFATRSLVSVASALRSFRLKAMFSPTVMCG